MTPVPVSLQEYAASEDGGGGALNQEYVENKVEELDFAIRREEIEKAKVDACLQLLKHSSFDVQPALDEAYANAAEEDVEGLAHRGVLTDFLGSSAAAVVAGGVTHSAPTGSSSGDSSRRSSGIINAFMFGRNGSVRGNRPNNNNAGLSRTSAKQLANDAWSRVASTSALSGLHEPSNFIKLDDDGEEEEVTSGSQEQVLGRMAHRRDPSPEVDWTEGGRLPRATAMYEFLATRDDEVNLVCHEKVVLLGTGDGEDWAKVRSLLDGNEGLVPRVFLSIDPTPPPAPPHPLTAPTGPTDDGPIDAPKAEVTAGGNRSAEAPPSHPLKPPPPPPSTQPPVAQFVRALIDFSGTATDELSFRVGDVIHVFGRPAGGDVDDGWLEGELVDDVGDGDGRSSRGVFPSMLVEMLEESAAVVWRGRMEVTAKRRSHSAKMLLSPDAARDAASSRRTPSGDRNRKPSSSSSSIDPSHSNKSVAKGRFNVVAGGDRRRTTTLPHRQHPQPHRNQQHRRQRSHDNSRHQHQQHHKQQQQQQQTHPHRPSPGRTPRSSEVTAFGGTFGDGTISPPPVENGNDSAALNATEIDPAEHEEIQIAEL